MESISPATGVEFSAVSPDNATGNFVKIAQRIPVRIAVDAKPETLARLRPACRYRCILIPGDAEMRLRSALVALTVTLSGCQSAQIEQAQPTLHIPAAWRSDAGPLSKTDRVWWRQFHDTQLNQFVDQALRYNSDVLIARERVNEYQARVYAADSALSPELDAGLSATRARSQSAATGLPVHSTVYKGNLTASYTVDLWGRIAARHAQRMRRWKRKSGRRRRGSDGRHKRGNGLSDLTVAG